MDPVRSTKVFGNGSLRFLDRGTRCFTRHNDQVQASFQRLIQGKCDLTTSVAWYGLISLNLISPTLIGVLQMTNLAESIEFIACKILQIWFNHPQQLANNLLGWIL